MLYEDTRCRKEKEQRQNLKYEVTNKRTAVNAEESSQGTRHTLQTKLVGRFSRSRNDSNLSSVEKRSVNSRKTRREDRDKPRNSLSAGNNRSSVSSSVVESVEQKTDEGSRYKSDFSKKAKCFDEASKQKFRPCNKVFEWQHSKYVKDECGSGIAPLKTDFKRNRNKAWCSTPLSMYQATIGDFARQILCNEYKWKRDVKSIPPCNICEYVLPPCREYYRKYDCLKPCEEDHVALKNGQREYRDHVERYWQPCVIEDSQIKDNARHYAPHNSYLGDTVRRKFQDSTPCW